MSPSPKIAEVGDYLILTALARTQTPLAFGAVRSHANKWKEITRQAWNAKGVHLIPIAPEITLGDHPGYNDGTLGSATFNAPQLQLVTLGDGTVAWHWGQAYRVHSISQESDLTVRLKGGTADNPLVSSAVIVGLVLGIVIVSLALIAVAQFAAVPILEYLGGGMEKVAGALEEFAKRIPSGEDLAPVLIILALSLLLWQITRARARAPALP